MPYHNIEKWNNFKAYNIRDVETEISIQKKLSRFPVSDSIWNEYHLDQNINDRGIGVDMILVENAIVIDEMVKKSLINDIQSLTNLDNPNSVQQMKNWLSENGFETESLSKSSVSEMLKTAPDRKSTRLNSSHP